jgi:hypothetical protein
VVVGGEAVERRRRGSGGSGDAIEGWDVEAGARAGRCPGGGRRREMPRRRDVEEGSRVWGGGKCEAEPTK